MTGGFEPCGSLAFAGDVLYLASGQHGVGRLDLSGTIPDSLTAVQRDQESSFRAGGAKAGPDIGYITVGNAENVVDVVTVPGLDGCFAITCHGEHDFRWKKV